MNENIDIRIREDGSRTVSRNIDGVAKSADKAADSLDILKQAAYALGAALAVDKLQEYADTWGAASGLIRTSTKSMEEAVAVEDKLYKAAQRTRTEYSAVVELYSRAARAGADLGASQQDLIKFTEGVGKALAIQGTSASQAAGALFQLGQALTGNKIQAQEYNSLIDQAPELLKVVAQNLEGTGGTIGGLTKLVKDGQVTNKEFFDAFLAGSAALDERFQQTSNLFSQGWTVLANGMAKFIGQLNQSFGLSDKFTASMQWLAENLPTIAKLITAVGAAVLVAFAPSILLSFVAGLKLITQQLQILFWLAMANPWTAFLAVLTGVIAALYLFRDQIKLGIDDTTTLGDLGRAAWEGISAAASDAWDIIGDVYDKWTDESSDTAKATASDTEKSAKSQEAWWLKLLRTVVQVFDMIGATVRAVMLAIGRTIGFVVAESVNRFQQLGDVATKALTGDFAGAAATAKQAATDSLNVFNEIGNIWGNAFSESFDSQVTGGLESVLDGWIKRAQEIGKERAAGAGADLGAPPGGGGGGGGEEDGDAAKKAARELERLKDALRRLQDQADPVGAAVRELADAENTLTKAVQAGLITAEQKTAIYATLKEQMRDMLEPYEVMIESIQRENEWLKLSADQYRIESELYQRVTELKRNGVAVTQAQTDALRQELEVREHLARVAQQRDAMEQDTSAAKLRTFTEQLEAFKQLMQDPSFTDGDVVGGLQKMLPWANFDNTQQMMDAYIQQHADMYAQIKALEDKAVIDHQTAEMLKAQADVQFQEQRLSYQRQFFGTLAGLSSSQNRHLAAIGKAAAVTQATIDGVLAVQKTMAETPYPYNIPLAIAQGALAAANVAQIVSQPLPGYRTGGEFMVGGGGVSDSQTVAFRATPGERVTVTPPGQEGPAGSGAGAPPVVKVNNVTVVDKGLIAEMVSSDEGAELILNVLDKHPERIQALAQAG